MALFLTGFRALQPAFTSRQSDTIAWLAAAHTQAEATRVRGSQHGFEHGPFLERMRTRLARFGCGEDKISTRSHELGDFTHQRWADMEIYRMLASSAGDGMRARTERYERAAERVFRHFYEECEDPPGDLVHVTCTGYVSPSAAQRLVADKGWGRYTRVTHAYHMGCYAAIPALRIASGIEGSGRERRNKSIPRTDIVHTEACSLHLNPSLHDAEQLVIQTLFADGFIGYSVCDQSGWDKRAPALRLLQSAEELLPDSSDSMAWFCSDSGMQMALARDVPERLTSVLRDFVERLTRAAGLGSAGARSALYAVHPGGPKILDQVRDTLGLEEEQIAESRLVLREHGNMSSATLPHVWARLACSPEVPAGHPIVSLAFGPGLTICGAVLEKATA